ncbi:Protein pbdc1 [Desmophyllum pertusum]|uniref:Protein pbdc1 n=1 Tax=Desmophyllum pertusum TaxID=174260 RepID=A0A9W9YLC3_9CNID|nr:Protein pbdc1 [Desmophyllum pertusum]
MAEEAMFETDANKYGNDAQMEMVWALKAHHQAETYFKLISAMDASRLHLTKYDDDIYRQFKRYFKMLKVDLLKVEDLKSEEAKVKWRPFCNMYEGKVEDYNFGTLLRIDCNKDYNEENTILVTRIQFYAVEIARNRRGLNKHFLEKSTSTEDSHER